MKLLGLHEIEQGTKTNQPTNQHMIVMSMLKSYHSGSRSKGQQFVLLPWVQFSISGISQSMCPHAKACWPMGQDFVPIIIFMPNVMA